MLIAHLFLGQPGGDIGRFTAGVVQAALGNRRGRNFPTPDINLRGRRVHSAQLPGQGIDLIRGCQIAFGHQQAVSHRHLFHRFGVNSDLAAAMRRINSGYHAINAKAVGDEKVLHQGVDNRRWVGQSGRFDDDAADRLQLAAHATHEQFGQAARQVAAYRAADATGVEHDHVFIDFRDQMMVDRNTAELVDQHRRSRHFRLAEQMIEQSCLACPEKTSQ